jgi:hypothetical protein
VNNMMNADAAATRTKGPDKPVPQPAFASPEHIDLDRVVFDPEYRARVRDALNRADARRDRGLSKPSRERTAA